MHFTHKAGLALALLTAIGLGSQAQAGTVGAIQAFYYAPNSFGVSSTEDAPTFVFENTSSTAITNGVFSFGLNGSATPDTFAVGTIAAHQNFLLTVGVTSDGQAGHTFFAPNGPLDTSDNGMDGDNVAFGFTGQQGTTAISSGTFTAGASAGPSEDGSVSHINFLGGPNGADGPCNQCFAPTVVAQLSTPNPVPEASTTVSFGLLLAVSLGGLVVSARRRKVQASE